MRKPCSLAVLVSLVLTAVPGICVADCISWEKFTHPGGGVFTGEGQREVAVWGTHAYVAEYQSGFDVIDIRDPDHPRLTGRLEVPGSSMLWGIAAYGGYAYLTDINSHKFFVIDATNDAAPQVRSTLSLPDNAWAVAVSSHYAFVPCSEAGLVVIDVSDPSNARIVRTMDTSGAAYDIDVEPGYAFLADWNDGFLVVDISDPTNPRIVSTVNTPHPAGSVAVSGRFAVGCCDDQSWYDNAIEVIDITEPMRPRLRGSMSSLMTLSDVSFSGDLACAADEMGTYYLIDVRDPDNPALSDKIAAQEYYYSGGTAFVPSPGGSGTTLFAAGAISYDWMAFRGWFQAYHVSRDPRPQAIGTVPLPCCGLATAGTGSLALVAEASNGLRVVDVTDPHNPAIVGALDTPGYAIGIAADGDLACLADYDSGLRLIDVSDPASPRLLGSVDTPGTALDVAISGKYAFVADEDAGLEVIDFSVPGAPRIVGHLATSQASAGIAVSGTYAYLGAGNFQVVDVSNPANPVLVGSVGTPWYARGVAVSGGYAYVADSGASALCVIDIRDPTHPTTRAELNVMDWCEKPVISGTVLYLPIPILGVQVFDISDPERTHSVGWMDLDLYAYGVAVAGSNVCVVEADQCQDESALHVFPSECQPTTHGGGGRSVARVAPLEVSAFPNPVSALGGTTIRLALGTAGPVQASVWDVGGRLVRTLHDGILGGGSHEVAWDGRDRDGRYVPAGIYWVRVTTAEARTSRQIVVFPR